jgi:lipopolysaccharide export system protein LptC
VTVRGLKLLSIVSALLLIGGAWLFWVSFHQGLPEQSTGEPGDESPLQLEFKGTSITGYEGTRKLWEVSADKVEVAQSSPITSAQGHIKATLFDEKGKAFASITADFIRLNSVSKNLEVGGGVIVRTNTGLAVATDLARWMHSERKLYCPKSVVANTATIRVTAPRLTLDSEKERITCPGPVTASMPGLQLTGKGLSADSRLQQMDVKGRATGWLELDSFGKRAGPARSGV